MIKDLYNRNRFAFKWIGIAFIIKLALFIFFAVNFYLYWPKELNDGLFNASGDTSGYYDPLESLVQGKGYYSMGRMPALLPIYVPLRWLFSVHLTQTIIILLQFLTSVVSVYVLARIAQLIFKKDRIFYITFFLYAFSSFVSIWDNVGYMDSFAASFLIFSIYFLYQYKLQLKWKYILYSGFFIAWSVFFRQLHGLVYPIVLLFFLFDLRDIKRMVKASFLYCLPLVLALSSWTYKNYRDFNRMVILTGPLTECFPGMITEELLSIRELVTVWGGDTQPWVKGSDAEWFFSSKVDADNTEPESKNIYTKAYTIDSLRNLRKMYLAIKSDSTLGPEEKKQLKAVVNTKAKAYTQSYKDEHFFRYLLLNKLKLTKRLLIPPRLDDLPFPALSNMNIIQKAVKAGYWLLLIFVNVFGVIGCFLALRKRIYLALLPLAFIFILTFFFGFIEQRYLVPAYCFLVIFVAYVLDGVYEWYRSRKAKTA